MNVLVLCDNPAILKRAIPIFKKDKEHHVTLTNAHDINPRLDYRHILNTYGLVISLHCKTIFPKALTDHCRCINIHPGFLPFNRGMFPHVWSIINGLPAGVTIHEMDTGIDTGPIIFQEYEAILDSDTSDSLYKRIIDREISMLDDLLPQLISGNYNTMTQTKGNYNSMEDFKRLCELDLKKVGTFQEFYNLLRALTHGDYNNAYIKNTYLKLTIL